MRKDLKAICADLDFPPEAIRAMADAEQRIRKDPDAERIWQGQEALYEQDFHMDYENALKEIDLAAGKAGVHRYTAELLFFLRLTEPLREFYQERGISLEIWHDSCMDLRWKLTECHEVYQIWGSFVAEWFSGFFDLTRFALGRLQFELMEFPKGCGGAGERKQAINVHIPSCGPLDLEKCHEAYQKAADFFSDAFPDGDAAFVCHSWLLFPPNRTMLGEGSRIVRFMEEYDIFEVEEGNGDLWRIFKREDCSDAAGLPEETKLQRAYKKWLLEGRKAGMGRGLRKC